MKRILPSTILIEQNESNTLLYQGYEQSRNIPANTISETVFLILDIPKMTQDEEHAEAFFQRMRLFENLKILCLYQPNEDSLTSLQKYISSHELSKLSEIQLLSVEFSLLQRHEELLKNLHVAISKITTLSIFTNPKMPRNFFNNLATKYPYFTIYSIDSQNALNLQSLSLHILPTTADYPVAPTFSYPVDSDPYECPLLPIAPQPQINLSSILFSSLSISVSFSETWSKVFSN